VGSRRANHVNLEVLLQLENEEGKKGTKVKILGAC